MKKEYLMEVITYLVAPIKDDRQQYILVGFCRNGKVFFIDEEYNDDFLYMVDYIKCVNNANLSTYNTKLIVSIIAIIVAQATNKKWVATKDELDTLQEFIENLYSEDKKPSNIPNFETRKAMEESQKILNDKHVSLYTMSEEELFNIFGKGDNDESGVGVGNKDNVDKKPYEKTITVDELFGIIGKKEKDEMSNYGSIKERRIVVNNNVGVDEKPYDKIITVDDIDAYLGKYIISEAYAGITNMSSFKILCSKKEISVKVDTKVVDVDNTNSHLNMVNPIKYNDLLIGIADDVELDTTTVNAQYQNGILSLYLDISKKENPDEKVVKIEVNSI